MKLAAKNHLLPTWLLPTAPSPGSHAARPEVSRGLPCGDTWLRSPLSLTQSKAALLLANELHPNGFAMLRASC